MLSIANSSLRRFFFALLFFIKLSFLFSCGFLVLLVFWHQVIHVRFSLENKYAFVIIIILILWRMHILCILQLQFKLQARFKNTFSWFNPIFFKFHPWTPKSHIFWFLIPAYHIDNPFIHQICILYMIPMQGVLIWSRFECLLSRPDNMISLKLSWTGCDSVTSYACEQSLYAALYI